MLNGAAITSQPENSNSDEPIQVRIGISRLPEKIAATRLQQEKNSGRCSLTRKKSVSRPNSRKRNTARKPKPSGATPIQSWRIGKGAWTSGVAVTGGRETGET